ncbi:MAG: hypothetical protein WBK55_00880 [Alphaproteobacteria bacterium]
MDHLTTKQIREKLTTTFGRQAFEKLNEMKPTWVYSEGRNSVILAADIGTRDIKGGSVNFIGVKSAKTLDDAVSKLLISIQEKAVKPDQLVVVNAGTSNKRKKSTYIYDKDSLKFLPYEPA